MTKKQLEDYASKKAEIKELRYKLAHLGEGDSMIGHDTVMDYRTGFPKPQAVVGFDQEKYDHLKKTYQERLNKLERECEEAEIWINQIPESLTRRIFRMRFIDGMKMKTICEKTYLDRSTIYRKMDKIFKSCDTMHQMRHYNK